MGGHSFHHNYMFPTLLPLVLVLGAAPLVYCGGAYSWFPATAILSALAFLARIVTRIHGHRHLGMPVSRKKRGFFQLPVLLAIPVMAGALQLLPLGRMISSFSPCAYEIWSRVPDCTARFSIAPFETVRMISLFVTAWLVCCVVSEVTRHKSGLLWVAFSMIAAAVGNAIVGLANALTAPVGQGAADGGSAMVLAVCRGNFMNRNHLGFFLVGGLLLLSGALLGSWTRQEHHRLAEAPGLGTPCGNILSAQGVNVKIVWEILACFLLVVALLETLSRGAFISLIAGMLLLGLVRMLTKHIRHFWKHAHLLVLLILLLGGLFFALPPLLGKLSERFDSLVDHSLTVDARMDIWRYTIRLVPDYWLMGTGLGGYGVAIQQVEGLHFDRQLVKHAHNDWLEAVVDMGVPAAVLLMAGLAVYLFGAWKRLWRMKREDGRCWYGWAAMAAIVAGGIHEFFDFSLQAGPNMLAFAALLGILEGVTHSPHYEERLGKKGDSSVDAGDKREADGENSRSGSGRKSMRLVCSALLLGVSLVGAMGWIVLQGHWLAGAVYQDWLWNAMQPDAVYHGMGTPPLNFRMELAEGARRFCPGNPIVALHDAELKIQSALLKMPDDEAFRQTLREAGIVAEQGRRYAPADPALIFCQASIAEYLGRFGQAMDYYRDMERCMPTIKAYRKTYAEACMRNYRRLVRNGNAEEAERARLETLKAYSDLQDMQMAFPEWTALCRNRDELLKYCHVTAEKLPRFFENFVLCGDFTAAEEVLRMAGNGTMRGVPSDDSSLLFEECSLALKHLRKSKKDDMCAQTESWSKALLLAQQKEVAELREALGNASLEAGVQSISRLEQKRPLENHELNLLEAEWNASQGKVEEAVVCLMPFAWTSALAPTAKQLGRALALLNTPRSFPEKVRRRALFLRSALAFRLMMAQDDWKSPDGRKQLEEHHARLQALDEEEYNSADYKFGWYQHHLIPLYQAEMSRLLGCHERAAQEAEKCLKECPCNLKALKILAECGREKMTADEAEFEKRLSRESCPKSLALCPGVLLKDVTIRCPARMTFSSAVQVTMIVQCAGKGPSDGKFELKLMDGDGEFYCKEVDFKQATGMEPMRWKEGQLFKVDVSLDMPLVAQFGRGRRFAAEPGVVFLRISAFSQGKHWQEMPRLFYRTYLVRKAKSKGGKIQ